MTAGNSSQIVDGAAAVLIASEQALAAHGLEPRARFVSFGLAGVDPTRMLHGNPEAIQKALDRAGLTLDDIGVFEVNEAFAVVVLQTVADLGLEERLGDVNPNGGGISLGHPLGATGARITATLLPELERRGARYGVASMCVGFGMAIAAVVERVCARDPPSVPPSVGADGDVPRVPEDAARRGALPRVALGAARPHCLRGLRAGGAGRRCGSGRRRIRVRAGRRSDPKRQARGLARPRDKSPYLSLNRGIIRQETLFLAMRRILVILVCALAAVPAAVAGTSAAGDGVLELKAVYGKVTIGKAIQPARGLLWGQMDSGKLIVEDPIIGDGRILVTGWETKVVHACDRSTAHRRRRRTPARTSTSVSPAASTA